jgi:HEAT repeat protein
VETPADLVRLAGSTAQSEDARSSAVWMLGRIDDGDHAIHLTELLGDATAPDLVRWEVAQTLGFADDERAILALRAALAKEVPHEIRCSAANALGHNRANGSEIHELTEILLDTTDDPEMRGYAAEALAHTFQMSAVPPAVTKAVRRSVLDPADEVRYEAVWALGQIGRVKDITLLERVLATEQARETPNAEIVKEAKEAIRGLSQRRRNG